MDANHLHLTDNDIWNDALLRGHTMEKSEIDRIDVHEEWNILSDCHDNFNTIAQEIKVSAREFVLDEARSLIGNLRQWITENEKSKEHLKGCYVLLRINFL